MLLITAYEVQIDADAKHYIDGSTDIMYYKIHGNAYIKDNETMRAIVSTWHSDSEIEVCHPMLKHTYLCRIHRIDVHGPSGEMEIAFSGQVEKQEIVIPEAIDYPEREN